MSKVLPRLLVWLVAFTLVGGAVLVASGVYLRKDPAAYLPSAFPANQLLRDWTGNLGWTPKRSAGAILELSTTPSPSADYLAAVTLLQEKGYALHSTLTWGDADTLHVLIGDLKQGAIGGRAERAFFFVKGTWLGTDSASDSAGIAVVTHTDSTVTLGYNLYAPTDPIGSPSLGRATVRFSWDGQRLHARDEFPSADWASPRSRRGTPAPASPGDRPVVFIPGIMGSVLTDTSGAETWPQASTISSCLELFGPVASCQQRALAPNALQPDGTPPSGSPVDVANGVNHPVQRSGPSGNPLGGVLTSTTGSFFIWSDTGHYYDITAQNAALSSYTVVRSLDPAGLAACTKIKRCFVPVGVDWRRSSEENALRVLSVIQQIIAVTGSDRVNILAHSQGGLIANAIVRQPESVGHIYRIVTLGTPFLGAPRMLKVLLFADPCIIKTKPFIGCPIDPGVVQQLAVNYPGAAELMPSRAYFKANPVPALIATDGQQHQLLYV